MKRLNDHEESESDGGDCECHIKNTPVDVVYGHVLSKLEWVDVVSLQRTAKRYYSICNARLNAIMLDTPQLATDPKFRDHVSLGERRKAYYRLSVCLVRYPNGRELIKARLIDTYGLPMWINQLIRYDLSYNAWRTIVIEALNFFGTFDAWDTRMTLVRERAEIARAKRKKREVALREKAQRTIDNAHMVSIFLNMHRFHNWHAVYVRYMAHGDQTNPAFISLYNYITNGIQIDDSTLSDCVDEFVIAVETMARSLADAGRLDDLQAVAYKNKVIEMLYPS
jgi:hypothetical protein